MIGSLATMVHSTPFRATTRLRHAAAITAIICTGMAGTAQAEISVGLGRLGGVSVGGKSVANANVGIGGVNARATVGGGAIADVEAKVGSNVNADVEVGKGNTLARTAVNVGATGVSAEVGTSFGSGGGGGGATIGDGSGTGTGGGTGGKPANPVAIPRISTASTAAPAATLKRMRCADGGNTQVYNGMPVVDRNGQMLGWVHDTTLDRSLNISALRIQSTGKRCFGLVGGSYKVAGEAIKVGIDGATLR